jgi:hypothetical protein
LAPMKGLTNPYSPACVGTPSSPGPPLLAEGLGHWAPSPGPSLSRCRGAGRGGLTFPRRSQAQGLRVARLGGAWLVAAARGACGRAGGGSRAGARAGAPAGPAPPRRRSAGGRRRRCGPSVRRSVSLPGRPAPPYPPGRLGSMARGGGGRRPGGRGGR